MSRVVIEKFNRIAYSIIGKVINDEIDAESVYLYGKCGTGKTTVIQAIIDDYRFAVGAKNILYMTVKDFLRELVDAIKKNKLERFHDRFNQQIKVIVLDGIEDLKGKEGSQSELIRIISHLGRYKQKIIFIGSDGQVGEGYLHRFTSYIDSSLRINISDPDYHDRKAICRGFEDIYTTTLSKKSRKFLAERVQTVRELRGFFIKLDALIEIGEIKGKKVGRDIVEDLHYRAFNSKLNSGEIEIQFWQEVRPPLKPGESLTTNKIRSLYRVYNTDGKVLVRYTYKDRLRWIEPHPEDRIKCVQITAVEVSENQFQKELGRMKNV